MKMKNEVVGKEMEVPIKNDIPPPKTLTEEEIEVAIVLSEGPNHQPVRANAICSCRQVADQSCSCKFDLAGLDFRTCSKNFLTCRDSCKFCD